MSNWYVARDRRKLGPFSAEQIRHLALLGLVKPADHVLQEGAGKWVPAGSVGGLVPAAETSRQFFLLVEGKGLGPYPAERIRASLMSRRLPPETPACAEGSTTWTPLAQLADFRDCLPAAPASSHAQLGPGSSFLHLSEEEARIHLAGKQGDQIARLISTLFDLRRRCKDSPATVELIDRNIHDLKDIRERAISAVGAAAVAAKAGGGR